jgi:hypothetical protein
MLLIYSPQFSTRCDYVFDLIFREELGLEYMVTSDIAAFQNCANQKINYSDSRIEDEFFIKSSSLLFEEEIKKQEILVEQKQQIKVLFPNEEDSLGFDIFSSVFYLISRYEEYLPFNVDKFGRYRADNSLAFQNGFLHLPVVNIWIKIFQDALQKKFPSLQIKPTTFNAILTYDIDVAYKFLGRSFGRSIGSFVKDIFALKIKNVKLRIQTLLKAKKDPWDVYDKLEKMILQNKLESVFFFLLADKSNHDHNLNYQHLAMKELVNKIEAFSEIGIHPSFYSSVFPEKIKIEKERLEILSTKKITKSRQHYLKFNLPDTYNALIRAGILADYSMGYPEATGFRAGTCKPFYFYDLKNEKKTGLRIFPVTCMDATFIYYSKKTPEKSLMEILSLLKEIKKVNGTFISIFHNENLGEDGEAKKWQAVHEKMILQIKSYLKRA